ncbi:MAG: CehA/McbA family metallohydrolase [Candidatus Sericytochromatia bacterium]|nr:CehA/McbA family metallohydrolase [Candidatus Tanganyikabacteria bacterium]
MPSSLLPLLAQWIMLSNHTHTLASPDSGLQVAQLAGLAEARGVHAVVITDHNSVAAVLDPAFKASGPVTLIEGQEWGDILGPRFIGHIGMMGLRGDVAVSPRLPLDEALGEARARGALAVVNHPFNVFLPFKHQDLPAEAGGIEVWNQPWNSWEMNNGQALAWWDAVLRAGRRAVGVGGSDVHGIPLLGTFGAGNVDEPVNLVWAEDASTDAIMRALHAGRVVITRDAKGPRLDMQVGAARIGDEAPGGAPATASVRVTGGNKRVLALFGRDGKVFEQRLESDDAAIEVPFTPRPDHDFLRAELREVSGWPEPEMAALSNPIYFRGR